ncbi:MAG: GH1 family beta-glucosidase [Anaerolineae bacterium]
MAVYHFPAGFVWGTATSSFQIEGAAFEDGRSPSIWDTFCRKPGAILDQSNGDVADDHYHRFEEDITLMAELGVTAYRFSIAWPRILPDGVGRINQPGLDWYKRMVDTLLKHNITPYATLYHWDLPQVLSDRGGWTQRFIADAFVEYADAVSKELGDRIKNWMTLNEPWVSAFLGYGNGVHAPGIAHWESYLRAAHHLMLAHGKAVSVLRANGDRETKVGLVNALTWSDPATDSEADRLAASRHYSFHNRWFLDPPLKGVYPENILNLVGWSRIPVEVGDMEIISTPIDFLGVNYYMRGVVENALEENALGIRGVRMPDSEYTHMDWEVWPEGLYNLLMKLTADYGIPLYITENGAAFEDEVTSDGRVHDVRRTAYYQSHLAAAHRAITHGAPLKGYFAWSLLDNFEWGYGYARRFGLCYVDYNTQQRIMKDTAIWYAQTVDANGFALEN